MQLIGRKGDIILFRQPWMALSGIAAKVIGLMVKKTLQHESVNSSSSEGAMLL